MAGQPGQRVLPPSCHDVLYKNGWQERQDSVSCHRPRAVHGPQMCFQPAASVRWLIREDALTFEMTCEVHIAPGESAEATAAVHVPPQNLVFCCVDDDEMTVPPCNRHVTAV